MSTPHGVEVCAANSAFFSFLRLAYTHSYARTAPCSSSPLMRTCRVGVVGTAVPAGGPTGTGWGYQNARPPSPSPVTPEEFLFSRMTQSEPDVSPDGKGQGTPCSQHHRASPGCCCCLEWAGAGFCATRTARHTAALGLTQGHRCLGDHGLESSRASTSTLRLLLASRLCSSLCPHLSP